MPLFTNVLELDFSHLGEKGVGYARHRSRLKEVSEMRTLPPKMVQALVPFAPLFSKRVWQHWDSPASTDSFTLRDVGFSYSILLEVRRALVT
jgi:hypothetical protein